MMENKGGCTRLTCATTSTVVAAKCAAPRDTTCRGARTRVTRNTLERFCRGAWRCVTLDTLLYYLSLGPPHQFGGYTAHRHEDWCSIGRHGDLPRRGDTVILTENDYNDSKITV